MVCKFGMVVDEIVVENEIDEFGQIFFVDVCVSLQDCVIKVL